MVESSLSPSTNLLSCEWKMSGSVRLTSLWIKLSQMQHIVCTLTTCHSPGTKSLARGISSLCPGVSVLESDWCFFQPWHLRLVCWSFRASFLTLRKEPTNSGLELQYRIFYASLSLKRQLPSSVCLQMSHPKHEELKSSLRGWGWGKLLLDKNIKDDTGLLIQPSSARQCKWKQPGKTS